MTVNYTTLLGLAEPVTGTQSGTWGDDVNKGITDYLDIAIAGTQTISGTQTAVTLSITNGSSAASNIAQVAGGATGSAQYQIINCTGSPASLLTITAPASSKTYVIINATSTSQSVKIVAPGPTTGVTVAYGEKAFVVWNGSDFTKVSSSTAAAAGSTNQVQYNSSGNFAGSANLTFNGTTLVANDITDSSLTSGRVTYAGAAGNLVDSANLTFNGTTLVANDLTDSSLTAGRVTYAGTAGNLVDSANLTFNGTNLTANTLTPTNALGVAYGGTALATTPTNGQLLIGNGTNYTLATITQGTGITVTNASGSITIASSGGGSTSIGLVRAIAINCILC